MYSAKLGDSIMSGDSAGYIATLDIGTTTLRCHVVNRSANIIGTAHTKIKLHYPKPGWVEINPEELFGDIIDVIKGAVKEADIGIADVRSLGISTQRATFITWKKNTGEYLHNFITWKDLRAVELLKELNSSWMTNLLRWTASFLYIFTRNKKFAMGSKLNITSNHVSGRFLWVLSNILAVQEALKTNNLMFGTLETWLIYKLSGGVTYVTDISNASATGFYDPFDLDWGIVAKVLKIPLHILPKVVDNDYDFGVVKDEYFGIPIKIGGVMADQSSAMFGCCCFSENDIKVTMGTGAFLDVNTSNKIHPSLNGMYPLVGWRTKDEMVYMSEVPCSDAGSLVEWMINAGFVEDPTLTSEMATNAGYNDGLYFIPAFSGLGPPINNDNAGTGFIGIKPTTTKEHLVRAVLESIVFRVVLAYNMLKEERNRNYKCIIVDGGLSNNSFVCQMIADLTDVHVKRLASTEMSSMGVAFIAGLSCGMWKSKEEMFAFRKEDTVFEPSKSEIAGKRKIILSGWLNAAERFKSWL